MRKIFSKRNRPNPDGYEYKVSRSARLRIIHSIGQLCEKPEAWHSSYGRSHMPSLMREVRDRCFREYGRIRANVNGASDDEAQQAVDHFLASDDNEAIDFLEMMFQADAFRKLGQEGVDEVNAIFKDEWIGYEFSAYIVTRIPAGDSKQFPGHETFAVEFTYPEAIKKTNELVHGEVVMPTLQLLGGPQWMAANAHMLKAHQHHRNGEYRAAITECGAALETTLKIICTDKGWTYTPDKDVLGALIRKCKDEGLFYDIYDPLLIDCGRIRNKLGAHGTEPKPTYIADATYTEHMIHTVSSDILLLARLAGLR